MFDVFLAEMLILLLVLITTLRIFFTKKARIDSPAVLAPVAFVLSALLFFMWGADIITLPLCALAFVTFFINIRSLLRLSARLYTDHYNLRFIIPALLIAVAAACMAVIIVIFHPVCVLPSDFGATRTRTLLTGDGADGYRPWDMLADRPNITGVLYEYAPADMPDKSDPADAAPNPVILFVPKCTASVMHYEPYFLLLAQKGFRVISADFNGAERRVFDNPVLNSRFFRRLYSLYLRAFDEAALQAALTADTTNALQGYATLAQLALKTYGADTTIFFALENISTDDAQVLTDQFGENALGTFWLNRIAEYKTPNFGFIEQTDPLTAHFFGIERDPSFFIPRYVAGKTITAIAQAQEVAAPAHIIKAAGNQPQGDAP
ncbi:MAG: hypothetical protein K2J14_06285 [Treponemataceae bacterium]|nr:hypothetical protein [Treponemataceae bacterium]